MWAPGPEEIPSLGPGALHVWRTDLDRVGVGNGVLSEEERDRAARFRSAPKRKQWVRARAVLRELLGGYLGREPRSIEFEPGVRGKPAVTGARRLEFNISHSSALALFAFTLENPVGVDVERAGRVRNPIAVAERSFRREEAERLRALTAAELEPEFLRLWARHEAAVKCRGEGLGGPGGEEKLELIDLDVGTDAAAAVALERPPGAVALWRFELPGEPGS